MLNIFEKKNDINLGGNINNEILNNEILSSHPSNQPYTLHDILTYLSIQVVQLSAYCQSLTKYRHHRVKAMLLQMEEK